MEIWKDVVGYESLYKVSNVGNVKSLNYNKTKKQRILKLPLNEWGYYRVALNFGKKHLVHRLVALAFIPNPEKNRRLIILTVLGQIIG